MLKISKLNQFTIGSFLISGFISLSSGWAHPPGDIVPVVTLGQGFPFNENLRDVSQIIFSDQDLDFSKIRRMNRSGRLAAHKSKKILDVSKLKNTAGPKCTTESKCALDWNLTAPEIQARFKEQADTLVRVYPHIETLRLSGRPADPSQDSHISQSEIDDHYLFEILLSRYPKLTSIELSGIKVINLLQKISLSFSQFWRGRTSIRIQNPGTIKKLDINFGDQSEAENVAIIIKDILDGLPSLIELSLRGISWSYSDGTVLDHLVFDSIHKLKGLQILGLGAQALQYSSSDPAKLKFLTLPSLHQLTIYAHPELLKNGEDPNTLIPIEPFLGDLVTILPNTFIQKIRFEGFGIEKNYQSSLRLKSLRELVEQLRAQGRNLVFEVKN